MFVTYKVRQTSRQPQQECRTQTMLHRSISQCALRGTRHYLSLSLGCNAIVLIGGDKTGDDRWYDKYVPLADKIYDGHIEALKKESKDYG